jgi:hypothetical protein
MGSVTAFAKPHKANKEVNRINGTINFFGTTGMDSEYFII